MFRKVQSTAVKDLNRAVEMDNLQISQSTLQLMKVHTHIDLVSKNEKEREKSSSVIVHLLFGRIVKLPLEFESIHLEIQIKCIRR